MASLHVASEAELVFVEFGTNWARDAVWVLDNWLEAGFFAGL
jgi:hypothetical protein